MEKIRRRSRQRERIFDLVRFSSNHPTAQWIYETLKVEIPSLSLGNVYRNISILVEEGLLISREFGDRIEHLDAITEKHYHFICDKCKAVTDFSLPVQEMIIKKASKISGHLITGHTINFYGICEKCNKKN